MLVGTEFRIWEIYVSIFLTEAHGFWIYKSIFLFFGDDIVSFMTSSNFINSPVCETGE